MTEPQSLKNFGVQSFSKMGLFTIEIIMKHLFLFILLLVCIGVNAQSYRSKSLPARKGVYAELFGASMVVGVNYDSRFYENSRWGYRVGLAYRPLEMVGISDLSIPFEINYLVGRKETNNKLDLGVGVNLGCYDTGEEYMLGNFAFFNIGYRYQPRNGLIFRVGLSPKYPFVGDWDMLLLMVASSVFPYLSIGYSF